MSSKPSDYDTADIEQALKDLVSRIRSEADPDELNRIRKVFRKAVPLFMRSYVAAYLVKNHGLRPTRKRPTATASLFISIGKNRRVFPRDLVQILITSGKLQKGDIGDIKILDNYSFVEVDESKASEVIALMDGSLVRGRRITVNFAKKREEREPAGERKFSRAPSQPVQEEEYEEKDDEWEEDEDLDASTQGAEEDDEQK